jgi:hypothetical protein
MTVTPEETITCAIYRLTDLRGRNDGARWEYLDTTSFTSPSEIRVFPGKEQVATDLMVADAQLIVTLYNSIDPLIEVLQAAQESIQYLYTVAVIANATRQPGEPARDFDTYLRESPTNAAALVLAESILKTGLK